MRRDRFLPTINLSTTFVVLLVIVVSFLIGASAFILHSSISPLIIVAVCLLPVLAYLFLYRPLLFLYSAVFVVFLPRQLIGLIPITILQNYFVTLFVILAVLSWIVNLILQKHKISWKSNIFLLFGFAIWCLISLLWASNLTSAQDMIVVILLSIGFMLTIINQIVSIKALNGLMNTLTLIGWALVIASVATILVEGYSPGSRLTVLGINENMLGIQLMVALPGILWQAIRSTGILRVLNRLLSFLYLILIIGLIAMSGSRGSALSIFIIIIAFCFFRATRIWGMLGILAFVGGIILAPQVLVTILERLAIQQGDTLLGGREVLWQAAWKMILDHMWLGVGVGNARQALLPYVLVISTIGGNESAAAHNPVLQIWSELGLPGVLLYLGILGNAVWSFLRQYILVHNFKENFLVPYFAFTFSIFLGYIFSWIKAGGIEYDYTYFLMLSLLVIPSHLHISDANRLVGNN
jgi:putative inorganic carbon (HCO3(-)) transporter